MGSATSLKLGMILWNKVVQKWKLEKNRIYKNWSPKLIAFCKKSIDFSHLTFKVQFRHFLTNHNSLQDCLKTISFEHVVSWAKLLHFRTHHLWNSTTELTLKHISINICISGDFWGQIFKSCPKPEWAYSKRKQTPCKKILLSTKQCHLYLWGWCRMLVEIELLAWGWPHGVPRPRYAQEP